jgi:hypothetical protein
MSGQQEEEAKRNVTTILNNVRERGLFKSRQPEGKARDH